jgi:uncharacterized HAD superfamily protein
MSRIVFGSDLDGCLFGSIPVIIDWINREFGLDLTEGDMVEHSLENITGLTGEQLDPVIRDALCNGDVGCVRGAVDVVRWIAMNCTSHPIYFVTSRHGSIRRRTLEQLNDAFKGGLVYRLYHRDNGKEEVINDLGIQVFVEDRAKHAVKIAENTNCRVLLFDRQWNRHLDTRRYFPQITRVSNWLHVAGYVGAQADIPLSRIIDDLGYPEEYRGE